MPTIEVHLTDDHIAAGIVGDAREDAFCLAIAEVLGPRIRFIIPVAGHALLQALTPSGRRTGDPAWVKLPPEVKHEQKRQGEYPPHTLTPMRFSLEIPDGFPVEAVLPLLEEAAGSRALAPEQVCVTR